MMPRVSERGRRGKDPNIQNRPSGRGRWRSRAQDRKKKRPESVRRSHSIQKGDASTARKVPPPQQKEKGRDGLLPSGTRERTNLRLHGGGKKRTSCRDWGVRCENERKGKKLFHEGNLPPIGGEKTTNRKLFSRTPASAAERRVRRVARKEQSPRGLNAAGRVRLRFRIKRRERRAAARNRGGRETRFAIS